jgi:hypothetical protein
MNGEVYNVVWKWYFVVFCRNVLQMIYKTIPKCFTQYIFLWVLGATAVGFSVKTAYL